VDESTEGWYTASEVIEQARRQGFQVSNRLLVDWVGRGFLDRPLKTGRGPGGGRGTALGRWPDNQRRLFFELLEQRKTVKHVIPLCDIVVGMWLYFGDEYVPLRQARRALATWAGFYRRGSRRRALKSARELVDGIGSPGASREDRQALIDALATAGIRGRVDRDELVEAFGRVLPHRAGVPGAGLSAEDYANVIEARFEAVNRIDEVPDDVFESVRSELNWFMEATTPDPQQLISRACLDVIGGVGFRLLAARRMSHASEPTGGDGTIVSS
jgi:hypothetical protein